VDRRGSSGPRCLVRREVGGVRERASLSSPNCKFGEVADVAQATADGGAMPNRPRPLRHVSAALQRATSPFLQNGEDERPTLDSPPVPASGTDVRRGDGLSGQPSETVGERNLPFLMSSLDGDRDFRCLRSTFATRSDLASCATGMKLPHGLVARMASQGPFVFSCWIALVRQRHPNKE